MNQQINLYKGAVRRESPAFGALAMVASFLFCAMVLAGGWYFAQDHARRLGAELAGIERQEAAAAARLELLGVTVGELGDDDAAEAALREIVDELARRERLLALIDGAGVGDRRGFSGPLQALAQHTLDGLWLTRILVSAPNMRTTLEGRARRPRMVPEYLLGLAAEPALAGQRFDQFEIDGDTAAESGAVRFSMTSAPAERFAERSEGS